MRILFLDFDGVLNSRSWFERNREAVINATDFFNRAVEQLDPAAVQLVSSFVEAHDLGVVVSSTWRRLHTLDELNRMLQLRGWTAAPVMDVTPTVRTFFRGDEINTWLANHPEVTEHVILDDDGDFHPDQNLVRTSMETGATHEHIDLAIGFLI